MASLGRDTSQQIARRKVAPPKRPLGRRLQAHFFRYANYPMRAVLGLPFATPLSSRLMLVRLTGRKTGRQYLQPVSYVRDGDTLLTPGGGGWKLNLQEGVSVLLHLKGKDVRAIPELIKDPVEVERLIGVMAATNPGVRAFIAIPRTPDGRLDPVILANAIHNRFRIVRWRMVGPDREQAGAA